MRILVTGGAGFIGSHIIEALVKRGEHVHIIDNFSTGKRENLASVEGRVKVITGDLRDYRIICEAVQGIDVILHQAALPSVPRSIHDPITTNEVNIIGTLNVLQAAKDAGVKRVVYASSSSIYGDNPTLPKREDMSPNPLSPYAITKLTGERYCQVFSRIYGLQTVILRYFNVFGPRQDPDSQYSAAIPKFIQAMMNEQSPIIYGDGEQSRDFTYVANVVEANLLAMTSDCEGGSVINCACGRRITLNQLIAHINRILAKSIEPIYTDSRPGDIKHSLADVGQAKILLGYTPFVSFEEGLMLTIEAIKTT